MNVPDWFPSHMFKFLNRNHVDGMLKRGLVRIGTSFEFRKADGKTGARSDPKEVVTNWQPGAGLQVIDKHHPFAKGLFPNGKVPGDKPIRLQFQEGTILSVQSNVYIYSASLECSGYLKERMASEFDADVCVRIDNLPEFFRALSSHEILRPRDGEVNIVRYLDKPNVADFTGTDVFHKSNEFSWQKEIRAVWWGDNIGESGTVIEVPATTRFLSRVG